MWWNNVETKPGVGYPVEWENQKKHKGGWAIKKGKLDLKAGNRWYKLLQIFHNPDLPALDEYYDPWTYDYEKLINSPAKRHFPSARPKSVITGENMEIHWGPNWEDDLAGTSTNGQGDPNLAGLEATIRWELEQAFLMYLPRICEHCLNPACVASCPSGAIYKRSEDGIVLVDQEACRGWRFCVSGCPYKKVYFNWKTQKAEKCLFCFPRIEAGLPTVCSETCTGRLRYTGALLYDADRVKEVASATADKSLYPNHLSLFLNPHDPEVIRQARSEGIPESWLEAARRSPLYKLLMEFQIALPIHPEFRTLPMIWYIPPLSPFINGLSRSGLNETEMFPSVGQLRIPVQYLANLLTGGDSQVVTQTLGKLLAVRQYMRSLNLGQETNTSALDKAGLTPKTAQEIYRLLAIAKYDERNVIPNSHKEDFLNIYREQGLTGFGFSSSGSAYMEESGK